ncbi:AsmA family protein [Falsiroseomonas sp.]|uniref:AsmA family protein n=1 Tax=Falsiroseomonas sp. TaxID=2870721 RepID=UPI00273555C1|nr:AsmA family protein [Falsiroseomonas sp.]MDP3416276.1 AsmA family protein [Falsiroseomonas sp.]
MVRLNRLPRWLTWASLPLVILLLLFAFWSWDWFIPLAERRASAAIGRPVTIAHLHLRLGRVVVLTAEDVRIANPPGFAADPPFAQAERLIAQIDLLGSWRAAALVLPEIEIVKPVIEAAAREDRRGNWVLDVAAAPPGQPSSLRIGTLQITEGLAHIVLPHLEADLRLAIATREEAGTAPRLATDITGTYAGQPITGQALGGAVLALQAGAPWALSLQLANGPTRISLEGSLRDPLALRGAELRLVMQGPDMALLEKLTGVPIPRTPNYEVAGRLDYAENRFRFSEIAGRVGQTDIDGTLTVGTAGTRMSVEGELHSRRVDLADLGGFIGEEPGRVATPGQTPEQRRALARNEAQARVLPDEPINLPKLQSTDIRISYCADSVIGRNVPFDSLRTELEVKDGVVHLRPLALGVGRGQIVGNVTLTPAEEGRVQAEADVQFQRLDLSRMMQATQTFEGAGTLNGRARITGTGNSFATILGAGNGTLTLGMSGGNLSALLVDLSGLRLANALLSSLGVPGRTTVQCFVGDLVLQRGVLNLRTVLLDTEDVLVAVTGSVNLARERLAIRLRSESKSFTIGTLPTSILVAGSFRNPSVGPELGELVARGGAVAGLAALLAPVAGLLPTIQFGIGEDDRCETLIRRGARPAAR